MVEAQWERKLAQIFKEAETAAERHPGPGDIVMHIGGVALMSDTWSDAVPNVNSCELRKLPNHMTLWMTSDRLPARALVVNLSSRLRQFHEALADTHLAEINREKVEVAKRRRKAQA